eukprot:CAMPEP_0170565594 /NCGR_PEP_ID=MMETSP0211-20121228/79291_1 /TAXON_ID=311385 /ORGANISM="Pseudokeronopsis sp., Strain OXSARD2" /LENGTH=89 /DNA_ID=CAMNT_0010886511 /DNA_START=1473 /DNA_END=1742 /DNA_ORIENTATION=+
MVNAHIHLATFKFFRDSIEQSKFKCPKITENLSNLCMLQGVYELSKDRAPLLESGVFDFTSIKLIDTSLKKLYELIRPQIIPLIEALGV